MFLLDSGQNSLNPKLVHRFDRNRSDFKPYGFTCELWKAAPMRRPDRHNEIELNLLKSGSLTYRLGAFWAALPHQIIGSDSTSPHYFVITLPLPWFLQCQLPPKLVDRLLGGQFLSDIKSSHFELDLTLCRQWERDLEGRSGQPAPATTLELHARLIRLTATLPDTPAGRPPTRSPVGAVGATKAEQMASYIARHYQEALSVDDVARQVHLHPNYAMALFKRLFRTTMNDYLTHYRIAQA